MPSSNLVNLASLATVQLANAALPLIVFPHLLNVAGQDLYSQIALSEALALGVLTVSLYSFDLDAVAKVVGLNPRQHSEAISNAFSGVLFARLFVFSIGALVALLTCQIFATPLVVPLAWWLLVPLSHILQSAWLFQGLERNGPIAAAMLTSRVSCIALVLLFVDSPNHYLLVPALVGSIALTGALGLLAYAYTSLGLRICRVPISAIRVLLSDGRIVFVGSASVFMYRGANVILLGASGAGAAAIAAYSIAEKLVSGLQAAARPLNQLFFPKAIRALRGSSGVDRESMAILLRLTALQLAVLFALVVALAGGWMIAVDQIQALRNFPEQRTIAALTLVMAPAVFFGVINFMLGSIGLNHLGDRRYLLYCLVVVGLANFCACYFLSSSLGSIGAAISFVTSEFLLVFLVVRRYLTDKTSTS